LSVHAYTATEVASQSSAASVGGGGIGSEAGAVYNGAGRAYNRDARNSDQAGNAAAAASAAGASSSEISDSDNEVFDRRGASNVPDHLRQRGYCRGWFFRLCLSAPA